MDPHAASRAIVRERQTFTDAGIAPFNTHDLRRTVATQLGEMEISDELIGRVLNHAPRTVSGLHYNHAKYLGPMREALDLWDIRLREFVASNTV